MRGRVLRLGLFVISSRDSVFMGNCFVTQICPMSIADSLVWSASLSIGVSRRLRNLLDQQQRIK